MFARMPRYAPAASGIRSAPRIPTTGQNGSSRHVPASSGTRPEWKMRTKQRLLIRGFGVQVPGAAPVLTWGFIAPGRFFVSVLSSWLLRGCSRARCGCRKSHPCRLSGIPVLMEDAAKAVAPM
jgi:hypothetical protein